MSDDIQNMDEGQVRAEISKIESDPKYLSGDPFDKAQRDALIGKRAALYDKLYPSHESSGDESDLADPPSDELVQAMKEGLELREQKEKEFQEGRDKVYARGQEIAVLVDEGNFERACAEIRSDLVSWGIPKRDLELVDYLGKIINDEAVHPEMRGILEDFLYLVYDLKRKKTRR